MKLTEDEHEFFFLWRGLTQNEQWRILGRMEMYLEKAQERNDAAAKEPEKNNVICLAKNKK
jgi:hypothetical protein